MPNYAPNFTPAESKVIVQRTLDWFEENPEGHTKDTYARRADGSMTDWYAADAVCFCALGRILVETGVNIEGGLFSSIQLASSVLTPIGGNTFTVQRANDGVGCYENLDVIEYLKELVE